MIIVKWHLSEYVYGVAWVIAGTAKPLHYVGLVDRQELGLSLASSFTTLT